ncbi:ovarian cancer G-protein coupled receptor 1-like [Amia ocellicauda]|uniref:ovarian cancer G-protein coupled receptor 1-like n=1 Tax=Amia ocellicauda TaxID=2972642 RepID=UPI00346484D3
MNNSSYYDYLDVFYDNYSNQNSSFSEGFSNYDSYVNYFYSIDLSVDEGPITATTVFVFAYKFSILCFGLPASWLAMYGLYRLLRFERAAPIYMINLLFADFIQIVLVWLVQILDSPLCIDFEADDVIFFTAVNASVGFILCIALERYLVVAHPLWYRYRRTVKFSALVSAGVWAFVTVDTVLFVYLSTHSPAASFCFWTIHFFLPIPILIFIFLRTRRVLASTVSVRGPEKRRIQWMLTLVLSSFTALFLPFYMAKCFFFLKSMYNWQTQTKVDVIFHFICLLLFTLHNLLDSILYIFLRRNMQRTLSSWLPCCRGYLLRDRAESGERETTVQTVDSTVTSM